MVCSAGMVGIHAIIRWPVSNPVCHVTLGTLLSTTAANQTKAGLKGEEDKRMREDELSTKINNGYFEQWIMQSYSSKI